MPISARRTAAVAIIGAGGAGKTARPDLSVGRVAPTPALPRGGQHADGVRDRITWSFLTYIVRFRRRTGPAVRRRITEHGGHAVLVELTSRRQVQRWLAQLDRRAGHPVSGGMAEDG